MKKICMALVVLSLFLLVSCGKSPLAPSTKAPQGQKEHRFATIYMKDGGMIKLELMPEYAPNTVANFIKLAQQGFYNQSDFHRIVPGFVIQGGDAPAGKDQAPTIEGEFSSNNFSQNTIKHTRGVISMARTPDPNSANSQFFIMLGEASTLDGDYAAFGRVVEGMDVVDKIAQTPCQQVIDPQTGQKVNGEAPINKPVIEKVVVK